MTNYAQGGHVSGGGGFWLDGCTPRYIAYPAPDLSPAEAEIVDRFEAAPAAPESFDPIAAVRRVVELAGDFDDGTEWGTATHPGYVVRNSILAAIAVMPR